MRRRGGLAAILAVAAFGAMAAGGSVAGAAAATCVNGAADVGETYYPGLGNGGYDVSHYDLNLSYDPTSHLLNGKATITASATQNLCRFDLDLRGLTVASVTVNGAPAPYTRDGRELIVTPAAPLAAASRFVVEVVYSGDPGPAPRDPDNFIDGWNYTENGSYTSTPPAGADTWYPCNNTTNDKATFTITVTVPADRQVMSNGQLISSTIDAAAGTSTWVWDETEQMQTYLATVNIGKFTILHDTSPAGIPIIDGVRPDQLTATAQMRLATIGPIIDYFGTLFGPYPFSSSGAIVDVTNAGYEMETQTRPEFVSANGLSALAHELAHQWFGDNVAVRRMSDVWLSEGFATFANWLWVEHTGGTKAQASFNTLWARAANNSFWNNTVEDPGVVNQYQNATVYSRGGMTLQALRSRVGDTTFFQIMKDYESTFGGGTAMTQDFIAIAQRDSGQDLRTFFQAWLYTAGKPNAAFCYCEAPSDTSTTVGGDVTPTLALTLGSAATFGAFTPGIAKDYLATTTATVVSTAADAALSVADRSATATGHLVNGTFVLPQALQAHATNAANPSTPFADVGSAAAPLTLLTWPNPTSNDPVTLEFKQTIGATDALRSGSYGKVVTLTLSTTTP
jgi:aminopeptidase N